MIADVLERSKEDSILLDESVEEQRQDSSQKVSSVFAVSTWVINWGAYGCPLPFIYTPIDMTPKLPKKTDPLTPEEMVEAADMFMERYNIIKDRMNGLAKPEDILKVMENVAKLGHKLRADKAEEKRLERFGFVKKAELDAIDKSLEKLSLWFIW